MAEATQGPGSSARPLPGELHAVVATKLSPPHLRAGLLVREALVERLRSGRGSRLTLVCAPAGYGKTTLLAQWAAKARDRTPFAWVSLDAADSDPIRLWSHIIGALSRLHRAVGERSLQALAGGPQEVEGTALPLLVDELSDCPSLVLVLEDWHLTQSALCDQTLGAFVEWAPPEVQIVLSSRSDPGLPIARLRARSELTEIRASDLRVTHSDVAALFEQEKLRLSGLDVDRLAERTEGWIAGLVLALTVLKERENPHLFVHDFSGDSRYVFDYLAHDVLADVDPEVRDFMVGTSILDRLSGPLCDAVLETTDSATRLAEIERSNLFLVRFDEAGTDYRYHHLFAAMLRRELKATDPSSGPGLHGRASLWYEEHGDTELAVEHAIASQDLERASELVMRAAPSHMSTGRVVTVARWLEALSWPAALRDRQLAIVRAWTAGLTARGSAEVERWLVVAEDGPDTGPLPIGVSSIRSAVAMLRSSLLTRGIEVAEEEARTGLEREPPETPWRFTLLVPLGQAEYLAGRRERARATLEEALRNPLARDIDASGEALALSYLAVIAADDGDAHAADHLARRAVAVTEERHLSPLASANPALALGTVLMHGTDLHGAVSYLEEAVELLSPAGPTYWRAHALLRLADARHRIGDDAGAKEAFSRARVELDQLPDTKWLGELYAEMGDTLAHRVRREGFLGDPLSHAELRILRGLVDGHSLAEIGRHHWLSLNTVRTHRRSIYRKLGVSSREELVERAAGSALLHESEGSSERDGDGERGEPDDGSREERVSEADDRRT